MYDSFDKESLEEAVKLITGMEAEEILLDGEDFAFKSDEDWYVVQIIKMEESE